MYIETSLPMRPGGSAILYSPVINSGNSDLCIRFYYHAYGQHVGVLITSIEYYTIYGVEVLYTVTGDQGDLWQPVNIQVDASLTGINDFQVRWMYNTLFESFVTSARVTVFSLATHWQWTLGSKQIHSLRLLKVQNNAARVLARVRKYDHITPILRQYHWLPVQKRIEYKILTLVFKALHNMAPSIIRI